ncbi:EboA domain-containing protein [Pendulispora rubella]|uniref:EboA domain-containing protein n=1 Tax=Pendulispora rubella TaxID=2741070 RepID=A0ABZ2L3N9_9BACT
MSEMAFRLEALLQKRGAEKPPEWSSRDRFLADYSSLSRKLGKKPLALEENERAVLRANGIPWSLEAWGIDELGRVVALTRAARVVETNDFRELVETCYAQGDNRERTAVLRALPFLPDGELFVPLAVEACRSSVDTIFQAICCDNPFPARHFPEANYCQMVIKALFTGATVPRIVGLTERTSSELVRMANDFASERRAAGRAVPDDLEYLLNLGREVNQ